LGAQQLSASSDLDLIVIYDAQSTGVSDGVRSLPVRSYFAKLTQTFVTALTAPTSEGRLYQVDMRLRPSGHAGPVATSFTGFKGYQEQEAWTWEHFALTRARPVAGELTLCSDVEAVREKILKRPHKTKRVLSEMSQMRARIEAAKRGSDGLNLKHGTGGLQDIDLFAQASALIAGHLGRNRRDQIETASQNGLLPHDDALIMADIAEFFQCIILSTLLLTDKPDQMSDPVAGAEALLLRDCGQEDMASLFDEINRSRLVVATLIKTALENTTTHDIDLSGQ